MAEVSTLNGYKIKDKKAIRYYDTVALMKNDITLKSGMHVRTKGYYDVNDGGASDYHITSLEDQTKYQESLNNGLYATLIVNNSLNVNQMGAKGDGISDDTVAITTALNYAIENKIKLQFCEKTYIISDTLLVDEESTTVGLLIDGNNATIKATTELTDKYIIRFKTPYSASWGQESIEIKDLTIDGNYLNNGIDIEHTNTWSLKNVAIYNCLIGLRLCNTWYGNIDNSCRIGDCWYGILFDDSDDANSSETNTIYVGNISLMMKSSHKSRFNTELTDTVGIKIDTCVNAVKFIGTVLEHYDYGFTGYALRNSSGVPKGSFTLDKCYFENVGTLFNFSKVSTSKYINAKVEIKNCRVYPVGNTSTSKKGYIEAGDWFIKGNQDFTLVIGNTPRNLRIYTDLSDYFIDTTNINEHTRLNKISLPELTKENPNSTDGYIPGRGRLLAIQENNIIVHPLYMNGVTNVVKNYKALSINTHNILFNNESKVPIGLIINGEDNKKYMLSTKNGSSLDLIPMNNESRIINLANSKDAYWLWTYRNTLENGAEFFCIDIEKTVVLNNGSWFEKTNNYCAIGTSSEIYSHMSSNPQNKYWQPCWDVSFNRGVYYNVSRFDLGFDYFKNNDPKKTDPMTTIKVYGTISERPSTPSMDSIFYATDEEKYYKYTVSDTTWAEITPYI